MIAKNTWSFILSVFFFICFFVSIDFSQGADSITANQSLTGSRTIVSAGEIFEMGFFKASSFKSYVGIWYKNINTTTIVWVANRETPISDLGYAELKISYGNLVLTNDSQDLIWSTNVASTASNKVVAVLGDDGNLVLRDGSKVLWQSFDNPTDTFLPGGKIGYDKRTKTKQILTSWKNSEDPSPGLFTVELDPLYSQYIIRWNRTEQYWTSGAWDGQKFSLVPEMRLNYIFNFSFVDNANESYFTYSLYNPGIISKLVMDVSGQIKQTSWSESTKEWNLFWSQPRQQCEVFAYCGANGICKQNSLPFCFCLPGFKAKLEKDWKLKDFSGGCVREIDLQPCGKRDDKFLPTNQVSLPDNSQSVMAESDEECKSFCLKSCNCTAYSYSSEGCLVFNGNLGPLLKTEDGGRTIYYRLDASAPQVLNTKKSKAKRAAIGAGVGSAAVTMVIFAIVCIQKHHRRALKTKKAVEISLANFGYKDDSPHEAETFLNKVEENQSGIGVPFCSWESILAATGNFSDANKLGRGGFGPVYKGTFPSGQEIAMKRLSSCSTQGINEFQNEVMLIAKLQHRNLVRLLGYCVWENEKILLYEYMPNKSLDAFLFDQKRRKLLNWKMRFVIILGIARGVLYLHHDSRLRIIHRDLKTSNILLDDEMNPKISDFGLARIVEGKGTEASTNKVMGTYGYMSPEYASAGIFSIKSDVFSFGVVVLEIICGKRNTGFYQSAEDLNLLAYVWRLWNESKPSDLIDPVLRDSCRETEVIKCINIGLLCVEEDPDDRPTMSNVVYMLSGETAILPVPKQPSFVMRRRVFKTSSSSQKPYTISNELTMSAPQGR